MSPATALLAASLKIRSMYAEATKSKKPTALARALFFTLFGIVCVALLPLFMVLEMYRFFLHDPLAKIEAGSEGARPSSLATVRVWYPRHVVERAPEKQSQVRRSVLLIRFWRSAY